MNLLDALKKTPGPKKIGDFHVRITRPEHSLEFSGFFSKMGNSIYANYQPMLLAGDSKNPDEELAKIKALFRLVVQIELRLNSFKRRGSFLNLFESAVPAEVRVAFETYAARASDLDMYPESQDIPVHDEHIERISQGVFEISFPEVGTIQNIAEIQRDHLRMHDELFAPNVLRIESNIVAPNEFTISMPEAVFH